MANEFQEMNDRVIREFRENDGQVGPPFEGAPVVLFHHVGAKSGTERITPVVWYHNLKANPDITVEIGHGPEARTETRQVHAEELTGDERERIWSGITKANEGFAEYDRKTQGIRTIPLFALTPTA